MMLAALPREKQEMSAPKHSPEASPSFNRASFNNASEEERTPETGEALGALAKAALKALGVHIQSHENLFGCYKHLSKGTTPEAKTVAE